MWLKVSLLLFALFLLAISSLTALKVPVAVNWKFALLAGEFGYYVAILALLTAAAAWFSRGSAPALTAAITVVVFLAIALFLKPEMQAARIGAGLPTRLAQAFGPVAMSNGVDARAVFSWKQLFGSKPPAVTPQDHVFAPGLHLNFYRATGSAPAPCVIVVHGGGWDSGDKDQLTGLNDWLVREGYAVAAIDYRLAPANPWPAQREDTLAAIAWIKAQASMLGIDPTRLVLLGRSAGGQIATAVGYAADDPAIRGVAALYAPHDMRFVWSISRSDDALNSTKLMAQYFGGPPDGARGELYDSASAQLLVRRDVTPPTLLIHGKLDTLVWNKHSERLSARLAEEGIPHVFVELPWAVHAFEINLNGPGGQLTTYALRHFLAAVTK